MCYLSASTAIGLSWQCQFAELRSVQQTTTEPLPYVSIRRPRKVGPLSRSSRFNPPNNSYCSRTAEEAWVWTPVMMMGVVVARVVPHSHHVLFSILHQIANPGDKECRGGCTRCFVVKHFKASGYAAVFKSRWQSTSSVPGGEYEYIDVVCDKEESGDKSVECYIMDIDFQAQFEIARPAQQYNAALKALPMVFMDKST